jgi:hypothetical protein
MKQDWSNRKEMLIAEMWHERTAVTKEMADEVRASIRYMRKSLSKAQVEECGREFARRSASKTGSPVLVFSDGNGGTSRMDYDAARAVVQRGVGGPRAERDLVVLLAAFCLLSLVRDQLTSRASDVYYGALKNEVAVQFRSGSWEQYWAARFKAAKLLTGREGLEAVAKLENAVRNELTAATKALDEAVMWQFAVRKAECLGIHPSSAPHGAAHRN